MRTLRFLSFFSGLAGWCLSASADSTDRAMSLALPEEFRWSLLVVAFILNCFLLSAHAIAFFSDSMSAFALSAQYLVPCAAMLFRHDRREGVGAGLFAAAATSTIEAKATVPSAKAARFNGIIISMLV